MIHYLKQKEIDSMDLPALMDLYVKTNRDKETAEKTVQSLDEISEAIERKVKADYKIMLQPYKESVR